MTRIIAAAGLALALVAGYAMYPKRAWFPDRAAAVPEGRAARMLVAAPQSPRVVLHHAETSEHVLLIRNPAVVDRQDLFGAGRVLRRALEAGGVAEAGMDGALHTWLSGYYNGTIEGLKADWPSCAGAGVHCLKEVPFRLLAVVFRPDLTRFRCGSETAEGVQSCGTEIRFEYGLVHAGGAKGDLQIIIEFVLADRGKQAFQDLVESWLRLSSVDWGKMAGALEQRLAADLWAGGAVRGVRLRLLSLVGVWRMREFRFAGGRIDPAALDGEINLARGDTSARWYGSDVCQLTAAAKHFLQVLPAAGEPLTIPAELSTQDVDLENRDLMLGRDGAPHSAVRFRLGLNLCSGCHNRETGMLSPFAHVRHREAGKTSPLSGFLTGTDTGDPGLGYYTAPRRFEATACPPAAETHLFNDLLRRDEYIGKVRELSAASTDWTAKLKDLNTYQAH